MRKVYASQIVYNEKQSESGLQKMQTTSSHRQQSLFVNELSEENKFKYFLYGTHPKEKENNSISILPQELRHKIWLHYAKKELSYSYLIEKNIIEVFDVKFTEAMGSSYTKLTSVGKLLVSLLAVDLFKEACKRKNFDIMNYFYDKHREKIFDKDPNLVSNPFKVERSPYGYDFWKLLFLTDVDHAFLVLKWFHEKGFEFDSKVRGMYGFAARANRLDIVKWIHESLRNLSSPTEFEVFEPLLEQEKSKFNVEMANYFFDTFPNEFVNDVTLQRLLLFIGNNGPYAKDNVAALKLIHTVLQRPDLRINLVVPISWAEVMSFACLFRAYECMEWINAEFEFQMTYVVVQYAAGKNDMKLLEWLIQNRKEFQDGRVHIPTHVFDSWQTSGSLQEVVRNYIVEHFVIADE